MKCICFYAQEFANFRIAVSGILFKSHEAYSHSELMLLPTITILPVALYYSNK